MKLSLSVPSKTFLLGEYLVLWGGPALVVTTNPRFELEVQTDGRGICQGIDPQSPAGQFIRQNNSEFQMVDVKFVDPYESKGGLGASSAQFVLAYAWSQMNGLALGERSNQIDPEKLWQAYRQTTWTENGSQPSGADVVAQFNGGVSYFASSPFQVSDQLWPFTNYDFLLVRTGNKLATHEHLKEVNRTGTEGMQEQVLQAVEALRSGQWGAFCQSINEYGTLLQTSGWVALETQEKIKSLLGDARIHAIKGCGAMGADLLLILCEKSNTPSLVEDLAKKSLFTVGTSKDLAKGFAVEMDFRADLQPAEV